MGTDATIEQALQTALPANLHAYIPYLAEALSALASGSSPHIAQPPGMQAAATTLISQLAGKQLTTNTSVVGFGDQSQLGDVTIQDVAGHNVIKHNLFVLVGLPNPAAGAPPPRVDAVDRVRLRRLIEESFSTSELHDLCFDLGIDHENLPGQERSARAREIIRYCERHSRLADLLREVVRLRPHLAAQLASGTDQ
jgi:hypothetical protein